jgi:hypothetical protein
MFSIRSAKSSVICKKNNGIISKNDGSINNDNMKCKVSIKEVHILNFEEYTNPMIFIYIYSFSDRPCLGKYTDLI